jgi:hypothetical protein
MQKSRRNASAFLLAATRGTQTGQPDAQQREGGGFRHATATADFAAGEVGVLAASRGQGFTRKQEFADILQLVGLGGVDPGQPVDIADRHDSSRITNQIFRRIGDTHIEAAIDKLFGKDFRRIGNSQLTGGRDVGSRQAYVIGINQDGAIRRQESCHRIRAWAVTGSPKQQGIVTGQGLEDARDPGIVGFATGPLDLAVESATAVHKIDDVGGDGRAGVGRVVGIPHDVIDGKVGRCSRPRVDEGDGITKSRPEQGRPTAALKSAARIDGQNRGRVASRRGEYAQKHRRNSDPYFPCHFHDSPPLAEIAKAFPKWCLLHDSSPCPALILDIWFCHTLKHSSCHRGGVL